MKTTFQQFNVNFPKAASEFEYWLMSQYRISPKDYDESITIHRYVIMARFLGEVTEPPRFVGDDAIENMITAMLERYENAINVSSKFDPLMDLTNLDWQTRNKVTEQLFVRQSRPSIHDALISLTNFRRPSLSDALIPYEGRSFDFAQTVELDEENRKIMEDMYWIDNIQWAWDVQAGKIEIPF